MSAPAPKPVNDIRAALVEVRSAWANSARMALEEHAASACPHMLRLAGDKLQLAINVDAVIAEIDAAQRHQATASKKPRAPKRANRGAA